LENRCNEIEEAVEAEDARVYEVSSDSDLEDDDTPEEPFENSDEEERAEARACVRALSAVGSAANPIVVSDDESNTPMDRVIRRRSPVQRTNAQRVAEYRDHRAARMQRWQRWKNLLPQV
jgi:hypothetical protein